MLVARPWLGRIVPIELTLASAKVQKRLAIRALEKLRDRRDVFGEEMPLKVSLAACPDSGRPSSCMGHTQLRFVVAGAGLGFSEEGVACVVRFPLQRVPQLAVGVRAVAKLLGKGAQGWVCKIV